MVKDVLLSRRDFLKIAGALGGGLPLAACAPGVAYEPGDGIALPSREQTLLARYFPTPGDDSLYQLASVGSMGPQGPEYVGETINPNAPETVAAARSILTSLDVSPDELEDQSRDALELLLQNLVLVPNNDELQGNVPSWENEAPKPTVNPATGNNRGKETNCHTTDGVQKDANLERDRAHGPLPWAVVAAAVGMGAAAATLETKILKGGVVPHGESGTALAIEIAVDYQLFMRYIRSVGGQEAYSWLKGYTIGESTKYVIVHCILPRVNGGLATAYIAGKLTMERFGGLLRRPESYKELFGSEELEKWKLVRKAMREIIRRMLGNNNASGTCQDEIDKEILDDLNRRPKDATIGATENFLDIPCETLTVGFDGMETMQVFCPVIPNQ